MVHLGPGTIRQDFAGEVDALDALGATEMLLELRLHFAAIVDVFEHLGHLINLIGTAFNFELLNEILLVLPRNRCLVEKTSAELL